jgi:hypothetical protein
MRYQTIKIQIRSLKKLRMLHALTGKSIVDLVENWVSAELKKLGAVLPEDELDGQERSRE